MLDQYHTLAQIVLAALLGALMGLDREFADKPAGLRTHMLVASAAALFVAIGTTVVYSFSQTIGDDIIRADPIRIIEAVITGITFLGAGTIIVRRESERQVEGLTTAASILVAAAIGICVVLSQYVLAIGVTALALFALRLVNIIEKRLT